jgi:hypothetical protein
MLQHNVWYVWCVCGVCARACGVCVVCGVVCVRAVCVCVRARARVCTQF